MYSEAIWDGTSLSQERLADPGSIAVRQSLRVSGPLGKVTIKGSSANVKMRIGSGT